MKAKLFLVVFLASMAAIAESRPGKLARMDDESAEAAFETLAISLNLPPEPTVKSEKTRARTIVKVNEGRREPAMP